MSIVGLCKACIALTDAHQRWEEPCVGRRLCASCGVTAPGRHLHLAFKADHYDLLLAVAERADHFTSTGHGRSKK